MTYPSSPPWKIAAHVYGYLVCFIATIVFVVGVHSAVNEILDLSAAAVGRSGDYNAFENFKLDYLADRARRIQELAEDESKALRAHNLAGETIPPLPPPTDAQLQKMFDDKRELDIKSARLDSERALFTDIELVLMAGVIFWAHWRWLRRLSRVEPDLASPVSAAPDERHATLFEPRDS